MKKKLTLLLGSIVIVFGAVMLVFIAQKDTMYPLRIEVKGDQKYFNVDSSVDGDLGIFYGGNLTVKLSKSKHFLKIESSGFSDEYYLVDTTAKESRLITLDFTKKEDSLKIIPPIEGEYRQAVPRSCSFFADKSWAYCNLSFGEVALKIEGDSWKIEDIDEYLTPENLSNKGAPEELIMYAEE